MNGPVHKWWWNMDWVLHGWKKKKKQGMSPECASDFSPAHPDICSGQHVHFLVLQCFHLFAVVWFWQLHIWRVCYASQVIVWPLSALICVCFAQGPREELGEPWFNVRFGKQTRHQQEGSASFSFYFWGILMTYDFAASSFQFCVLPVLLLYLTPHC